MNTNWIGKLITWIIIICIVLEVFNSFGVKGSTPQVVAYSDFIHAVRRDEIDDVLIELSSDRMTIHGVTVEGKPFSTTGTRYDRGLIRDLIDHRVKFSTKPPEPPSLVLSLIISFGPMILLLLVWVFFMRQMMGGFSRFGGSKARRLEGVRTRVTFADVAGCDEAKEEVREVVDFLKDPRRFQKLGGRIPRGLLLVGPPGTGKTLLAKGIAGEAEVPFFSISGSDFVEMFVGVGASRVRDMFDVAKANAPCIIFIDEIDAVGRARSPSFGGGAQDEREQTLNQILVEMDGFETNLGVIVVAATNRPDILDAALLRPGRFDRQVYVPLPDIRGREQILEVHMRKIPIARDVSARIIARGTPGMSGADLANLCNEAALAAARRSARVVEMRDFEKAKDKILMGPERRSLVIPEEERRIRAHYEAGHAVVTRLLPYCDPVHKVTIIPHGQRFGSTITIPLDDRHSESDERMLAKMCALYAGSIAESVFMEVQTTSGAEDLAKATRIARDMVMRYGMSAALGPLVYKKESGSAPLLGHSVTVSSGMSKRTMKEIDEEIRRIIDGQCKRAFGLISDHHAKVRAMAQALLEWESLDSLQIEDVMEGRAPRPPKEVLPQAVLMMIIPRSFDEG